MPMGIYSRKPLKERFFKFIKKCRGCWQWKGATYTKGYGEIGDGKRAIGAHRVSWKLYYGYVPKGLCVLHRCDNPPCTNPKHLFLGTRGDNNRDKVKKWRHLYGEKHHATTLSQTQVAQIKKYGGQRLIPFMHLAKIFNVTEMTIHNIVKNRTWRYVNAER
jgi:hypothetical protein